MPQSCPSAENFRGLQNVFFSEPEVIREKEREKEEGGERDDSFALLHLITMALRIFF